MVGGGGVGLLFLSTRAVPFCGSVMRVTVVPSLDWPRVFPRNTKQTKKKKR